MHHDTSPIAATPRGVFSTGIAHKPFHAVRERQACIRIGRLMHGKLLSCQPRSPTQASQHKEGPRNLVCCQLCSPRQVLWHTKVPRNLMCCQPCSLRQAIQHTQRPHTHLGAPHRREKVTKIFLEGVVGHIWRQVPNKYRVVSCTRTPETLTSSLKTSDTTACLQIRLVP